MMKIRRKQRKRSESDLKPFGRLKSAEKRSIVKWKKNAKKCVRR